MLCNSVEGNSHFHHESFLGMSFLFSGVETLQARTGQLMSFSSCVAGPDSSSVHEKYEFDDCIFAFTIEMNGKIIAEVELEVKREESSMTVYVKTINGKTISIKCDKKQEVDTVSEKVEMKTSIPRGFTYLVHQGKVLNVRDEMDT